MAENFLRMDLMSRPENVGICRLAVAHFAGNLGFSMTEVEELKVAVSEAVSNAVIHGYGGGPGLIRVTLETSGDGVAITVEDKGIGIPDISRAREPSYSTDPERMGLGFSFMESFSDEMEVQSHPGEGTRIRMVKLREEARAEEAR